MPLQIATMGDPVRGRRLSSQPIRPADVIAESVLQTPVLQTRELNTQAVEQPVFDAKKARLAKILAGTGVAASVLGGDSVIGAVGQGVVHGAKALHDNMEAVFLAQQDEAKRISAAIDERNQRLADQASMLEYRSKLDQYSDELDHKRRMRELGQRHLNDKEIERIKDTMTPEERAMYEAELDSELATAQQRRASAGASDALADNRRNNVGGFRSPGKEPPAIQSTPLMMINMELGQLFKSIDPDEYELSPSERIQVMRRIQDLQAELVRRGNAGEGQPIGRSGSTGATQTSQPDAYDFSDLTDEELLELIGQ